MDLKIRNNFIAFSAARDFLKQVGASSRAIQHFHYDQPEMHSLSDTQKPSHQIRFYTRQRILRSFRSLARQLKAQHTHFHLHLSEACDAASAEFFQVLGEQLHIKLNVPMHAPMLNPEQRLNLIAETFNVTDFGEFLIHLLNVGDSWLAVQVADDLRERPLAETPRLLCSLGAAYNLQERTIEAQYFFRRWADFGGLEKARAYYSLSMLFARHHKMSERNLNQAGAYLQDAYAILLELDSEAPEVIYETVFNRNGYALILFRQKRVKEAAILLEDGIERLGKTRFGGGLHETVLQNNLGRVYGALNDSKRAVQAHQRAIDLDPLFPEYHLDMANHLLDEGKYQSAAPFVAEALRLDPDLPEAQALQGFLSAEAENYVKALLHLETAYALGLRSETLILDLAKICYELNDWPRTKEWLALLQGYKLNEADAAEAALIIGATNAVS